MIKLFFITLLLCSQAIESCNNCWGYTGRRFRRQAMENVPCDCNCAQQYHVRYDDRHGYGCIRCGHRLIPTNPFEKESKKKKEKQAKPLEKRSKQKKQQKRSVTYTSKQNKKSN